VVKDDSEFKGVSITYHDSCYLGRGNDIYEAPRSLIEGMKADIREMKRNKSKGMCCGAGGAQMFKEEEAGNTRVNFERAKQAKDTECSIVASACPFCMTMMSDGIKTKGKEDEVKVLDLAELIANFES